MQNSLLIKECRKLEIVCYSQRLCFIAPILLLNTRNALYPNVDITNFSMNILNLIYLIGPHQYTDLWQLHLNPTLQYLL